MMSFKDILEDANKGEAFAQYTIGVALLDGDEDDRFEEYIEQDVDRAIEWLEKACDQHYLPAQVVLGRAYFSMGEYEKAREYIEDAAAQGDETARECLQELFNDDENPDESDDDDDGISESPHYRFEDLEKAAHEGEIEAQFALGGVYLNGDDDSFDRKVRKNMKKSVYWFKRAAEQGHGDAGWTLAKLYFDEGRDENGEYWLKKAAESGHEKARKCLDERTGRTKGKRIESVGKNTDELLNTVTGLYLFIWAADDVKYVHVKQDRFVAGRILGIEGNYFIVEILFLSKDCELVERESKPIVLFEINDLIQKPGQLSLFRTREQLIDFISAVVYSE